MNLPTIIVAIILSYYVLYFVPLLFSKNRISIKKKNKKLNKLRTVPIKTLKQQKQFLNLKFPKNKFRFTWKLFFYIVFKICIFMMIFKGWTMLFEYFNLNISFWVLLLFIFVFPVVFNYLLKPFGLEKGSDLTQILR